MTDPVADPPAPEPGPRVRARPASVLARRAEAALVWWADLQDGGPRADRRTRAVLRRTDAEGAIEEESVVTLYRALVRATAIPDAAGRTPPLSEADKRRLLTLAVRLALVLVHVRENDRRAKLARKLGKSEAKADDATLSATRLRTLLEARTPEEIVRGFRRAVALAGHAVDVADLARLLLGWESDRVRTEFVFAFFAADDFSPGPDDA